MTDPRPPYMWTEDRTAQLHHLRYLADVLHYDCHYAKAADFPSPEDYADHLVNTFLEERAANDDPLPDWWGPDDATYMVAWIAMWAAAEERRA